MSTSDHDTHDTAAARTPDPLLGHLADVLDRIDGPDPALVDRAVALWSLARLDAELLELVSDAGALAHRSDDLQLRFLTFQNDDCTVQVEIGGADGDGATGRELVGQVDPPGLHAVSLVNGPRVTTDDLGRFRLTCGTASFRLLVELDDGRRLLSPDIAV